jgi:hypothetical protein
MYLNSLSFYCFHLGFVVESIKELGGVSTLKEFVWRPHLGTKTKTNLGTMRIKGV